MQIGGKKGAVAIRGVFWMDNALIVRNGGRLLVLILLIAALLFVVTLTGLLKCNQFPVFGAAWCDAYWGVKNFVFGSPRLLIVYGDYGLGNPIEGEGSLMELLANPQILGVHADSLHVDRVNAGNLRGYDLVVVSRAKKINTKQLRAFVEYATGPTGGTLVWTGDAGTELGPDDTYLREYDREAKEEEEGEEGSSEENGEESRGEIIGPWARRDGEYMVSFDQLLGVHYLGKTYCEAVACKEGMQLVGNIETEPSASHPLVRGLSRSLPLYVFKGEDFALVETLSGGITTEVLTLDFGGRLTEALDRAVPMIVTAGLGERVVYYAMPPELYANPKLAENGKAPYFLPIESMYYGTLKG